MNDRLIISSVSTDAFRIDRRGALFNLEIINRKWVLQGDGIKMFMGLASSSWINVLARALKEIEHFQSQPRSPAVSKDQA